MILALVNNKGGVAKTTTAINLSAALAAKGDRVLLVDLDAQASASFGLGVKRSDLSPSLAEVLLDGASIRSSIRETAVDGLDIVTGSMALANADLVLANEPDRIRRLDRTLSKVADAYAWTVLDAPPSLSLLAVNALVAADGFIVPVPPHYLALEGLVNLFQAVDRVRDGVGQVAELVGILLTKVDYRTRADAEIVDLIRRHYRDKVFRTEVRMNVRLREAPSYGMTIFDYDKSATGADAYRKLAKEVRRRVKGRDYG